MAVKFYIQWESNHILKINKKLQISYYCLEDFCLHNNLLQISDRTESVNENFIYTTGFKIYYFDGNILQCGSKTMYNMRKLAKNIFFCDSIFLIVDEFTLYLLKINNVDELLNEIISYYPITELIFLYAKTYIKLYQWKKIFC